MAALFIEGTVAKRWHVNTGSSFTQVIGTSRINRDRQSNEKVSEPFEENVTIPHPGVENIFDSPPAIVSGLIKPKLVVGQRRIFNEKPDIVIIVEMIGGNFR